MKRVLIVCTGNICRSPMAVGLLQKTLADKGVDGVEVQSTGENATFDRPQLDALLDLAAAGIGSLFVEQRKLLGR